MPTPSTAPTSVTSSMVPSQRIAFGVALAVAMVCLTNFAPWLTEIPRNSVCVSSARNAHSPLATPQLGRDVLLRFEEQDEAKLPPYNYSELFFPFRLEGKWINRDLAKISRNCIMGLATGPKYSASTLRPFVSSLRATGYSDDIVLGVNYEDMDEATKSLLREFDVTVYDCTFMKERAGPGPKLPQFFRFGLYREWMYPYRGEDRFVIVSDVRDTYFQEDPFSNLDELFPPGISLHIMEEGRRNRIGTSPINSRWIKEIFGEALLEHLDNKPVICSGVTMGRGNAMYRYVTMMAEESALRNFTSRDQGYHNGMYYLGRFDGLRVRAQRLGEGIVATMGYIDQVVRDAEGFLLIGQPTLDQRNVSASNPAEIEGMYRPAIVHQYDRFDDVVAWVQSKWGE